MKQSMEILIVSAKIAKGLGVRHLTIYRDSQLVVGQVKEEYEVWEENMKKYLNKTKELIESFQGFDIR